MAETQKKIPTAKKRDKQNIKRRLQNRSFKSKMKTSIRSFLQSLEQKEDISTLQNKLNILFGFFDKGVKKRIIKKNAAARKKSLFAKRLLKKEQPPSQ